MNQIIGQWVAIGFLLMCVCAIALGDSVRDSNTTTVINRSDWGSPIDDDMPVISIEEWEAHWNEVNQTSDCFSDGDEVCIYGKVNDAYGNMIVIGHTAFEWTYNTAYLSGCDNASVSIRIRECNNVHVIIVYEMSW